MIQAIIFDCFGVLTTDGWLPFKQRHLGHDEALKAQATDLNKQVDAGLADYDDFIASVAVLAGISPHDARAQIEDNVANEALFSYIHTHLQPTYKVGLLSNAGANWLNQLFTPQQVSLFNAVSLSCDSGFVKPDARAYAEIANKLHVPAEACIFIDDQERYCTAAREAGMQAIVFTDTEQCLTDLSALLSNSKH